MFLFSSRLPESVPRTEPETERLERSARQLFFFSDPSFVHRHRRRFNPSQSEATRWGAPAEMCRPGRCGECLKAPGVCRKRMIYKMLPGRQQALGGREREPREWLPEPRLSSPTPATCHPLFLVSGGLLGSAHKPQGTEQCAGHKRNGNMGA